MTETPEIGKNKLYLLVRNNESILYEGFISGVTSFNEKGKFDIIPMHTNFISIIKDKIVIHEINGRVAEIELEHGILKVMTNKIDIFLGIDSLN